MRLIDADNLKSTVECAWLTAQDKMQFCKFIDNAPTVSVDEEIERQREKLYQSSKKLFDTARMLGVARPQGNWEEPFEMNGKSYHKCTNCHISSELILIDKFCPNCGAQMEGTT